MPPPHQQIYLTVCLRTSDIRTRITAARWKCRASEQLHLALAHTGSPKTAARRTCRALCNGLIAQALHHLLTSTLRAMLRCMQAWVLVLMHAFTAHYQPPTDTHPIYPANADWLRQQPTQQETGAGTPGSPNSSDSPAQRKLPSGTSMHSSSAGVPLVAHRHCEWPAHTSPKPQHNPHTCPPSSCTHMHAARVPLPHTLTTLVQSLEDEC
jgi:hypothetical protein